MNMVFDVLRYGEMFFFSFSVHGGWTAWYDWSSCSNSCGQGIRHRHRNCTDPPPSVLGNYCSGDSSEYEMCVLKLCSGNIE